MSDVRKPLIFATRQFPLALSAKLNQRFTMLHQESPELAGLQRSSILSKVRVVLTASSAGPSTEFMEEMPKLELVCSYGAGFDGIDIDYLRRHRIALTNGPGNSACVADIAMMLLLSVARGLLEADRYIREGRWDRIPPSGLTRADGLVGKRCGIVGLGAIGHQIARRAAAFDLTIGYHGRTRQTDAPYAYFENLHALAAWCDFLVLTCPLTESTRHIVDRRILDALGSNGVLINIARGPLVDELALVEALATGVIAGAGLDVFEHEPDVPQALRESSKVVMTPHIGGWTSAAMARIDDVLLDNLEAFFAGRPLITPILQCLT